MSETKPVLLSGVQPTGGGMTLGNYIGALRNWVLLQSQYDCLFCVVDLHAITVRQDPAQLRDVSYKTLAAYIASGIDPEKNLLFMQSHVPQHTELSWVLECNTYMGELSRMTQFKDKSTKGQNIGTGLFTYPSLMAADILLYQTQLVPIGHDQKQHLELARDLAQRLNQLASGNSGTAEAKNQPTLFRVPELYMPPVGARIMSLGDPTKKMSKSDEDANATVFLSDTDDVIVKKLKRAVTDSLNQITYSDEQPGVKNLISIQSALTGESIETVVASLEGKGYGNLKTRTTEIIISAFKPMREKFNQLLSDRGELDRILARGAQKARERAEPTVRKVHEALGLIPRA